MCPFAEIGASDIIMQSREAPANALMSTAGNGLDKSFTAFASALALVEVGFDPDRYPAKRLRVDPQPTSSYLVDQLRSSTNDVQDILDLAAMSSCLDDY